MSDLLNNKELVAVGHQFAKAMSSDTPIMDIAKIVSRLAERLDCTTAALREMTKQRDADHAECAALAAENAGLKESRNNLAEFIHEELNADYPLNMNIETPATDAFLAEVQAQGVDAVIEELNQIAERSEKDAPIAAGHHRAAALFLKLFADQLRKGVQS